MTTPSLLPRPPASVPPSPSLPAPYTPYLLVLTIPDRYLLFYHNATDTSDSRGIDFGWITFLVDACPSILFGILAGSICVEILKCVAVRLTNWENHKFQSLHNRSLVFKTFAM